MRHKLVFVHHGASRGGAATSLLEVLRRLDPEAYSICVLIPREGPFSDDLLKLGIRYRVVPIMSFYYCSLTHSFAFSDAASVRRSVAAAARMLGDGIGNLAILPFVLRSERPDVVIVNSATPLLSGLIARLLGYRLIWQVKEVLTTERSKLILGSIARVLRMADEVLVMSEFSARDLLALGVRRVGVACDGAVDLERFHPANCPPPEVEERGDLPSDRPLIGFVGQVYRNKGWHVFVQAALAVSAMHPEARFVVIGDSTLMGQSASKELRDEDILRETVRSMRLEPSFVFLGHRDDVELLLPKLTCLAFTSIVDETFGRVMTEAMACGVPVVASDVGAVREIVEEGETGFVYPRGDVKRLAREISRLIAEPGLRERMGRAARSAAEARFDIRNEMPKFEAAYRGTASFKSNGNTSS